MNPLRHDRSGLRAARNVFWLGAVVAGVGCSPASPTPRPSTPRLRSAAAHSAAQPGNDANAAKQAATSAAAQPLEKALKLARGSLETLEKIKDYSCIFVKQERVGGDLLEEERLEMKVRHKPFSVYMRFLEPESLAGQEAIYVAGQNDGKMLAHPNGVKAQIVGTLPLAPDGFLAMRNNRYPITSAGMKNLVTLLIDLGRQKRLLKDARVKFNDGDIDGRDCQLIEISNPHPVGDFRLAEAKIWLDRQWNVPLGFESWEWPQDGGEPRLVESYRYLKLKFDQGLTDRDFDPANPDYEFP